MANVRTVTRIVYVTEDGQEFTNADSARFHAEYLDNKKKAVQEDGFGNGKQLLVEQRV